MTAAFDLLAGAAPSPVAPGTIHAAVDRERRALADVGRIGPDAARQAVEITRAKLRNAAELAETQANLGRCQACGGPLDDTRPVVAVMSDRLRSSLWTHGGTCHETHSRHMAQRVDAVMAAAGYGPAASDHQQQEATP